MKIVFAAFLFCIALATPAGAATIFMNGGDVLLLDDNGGVHNVGNYAGPARERYEAYGGYNYHTDGDPADYRGEPYQNYRGYNNNNSTADYIGYIGRPGYLSGYYY